MDSGIELAGMNVVMVTGDHPSKWWWWCTMKTSDQSSCAEMNSHLFECTTLPRVMAPLYGDAVNFESWISDKCSVDNLDNVKSLSK